MRAKGMGANVIVTEVDPLKALEAVMDGFRVMPMIEAAPIGDFFCTLTGDMHVLRKEHFERMKDGAVICNAGHFDVELDLGALRKLASKKRNVRPFVDEYTLKGGRKVHVLADGRLVNLAAAEGHPSGVMDMSFAGQSLAAEYLVKHSRKLERQVYSLPDKIDRNIAALKLKGEGIRIDKLTAEQRVYLTSWKTGT